MTVQARFTDTTGKGVGRWRNYYRAEDLGEAKRCARHLVPSAQIRVMDGRTVVVTPRRVSEWLA
jgi:hypothetical protein